MHLTPNQRTGLIAGGALVVGGLTAFVAKKAMAQAPAAAPTPAQNTPVLPTGPTGGPPVPTPTSPQVLLNFAPVSQLTPGGTYLIASPVPSGFTTSAQLLAALQSAGWTNVTVSYFGPQGDPATAWPPEMPYPADQTTLPTMYVAGGVYSGSAPYAVPAGAVAYQAGPAVPLPVTPTVVPYNGKTILVAYTGQLYVGNATCTTQTLMTLLPNSTGLAIGSTLAEVTSKLAAWLTANCP